MNTQDIWSIAGAIIASIGGAGVIICAVSGFVCNRIAKHLDAKYEQRLNKELEKYKVELDRKYSLQGTTQSRYLTGGVPPVRFSM